MAYFLFANNDGKANSFDTVYVCGSEERAKEKVEDIYHNFAVLVHYKGDKKFRKVLKNNT